MPSLDEICPVVLEKKIFLILSRYFHYFVIISPWKKSRALHLNKLEFPSPKGCFVLSLVEIGSVVLEKKIFNFVNVFLLFCNYQPLEKGRALLLNKLESPSPMDALCKV